MMKNVIADTNDDNDNDEVKLQYTAARKQKNNLRDKSVYITCKQIK